MSIATRCPTCQAPFELPEEMAGETVRCQSCQGVFTVPGAVSVPEPAPAESIVDAVEVTVEPEPSVKQAPKKPAPRESGAGLILVVCIVLVLGGGLLSCLACGGIAGWLVYMDAEHAGPAPGPAVAAINKEVKLDADPQLKKEKLPDPDKEKINDKKFVKPQEPILVAFGPDGTYRSKDRIDPVASPLDSVSRTHRPYLVPVEAGRTYSFDLAPTIGGMCLILYDERKLHLASNGENSAVAKPSITHKAERTGVLHLHVTSRFAESIGDFQLDIRRSSEADGGAPRLVTLSDLSYRQFLCKAGEEPVGNLVWARDGKSFYVLRSNGLLQRITAADGTVEKQHAFGRRCSGLTMSGKGLLLTLPDANEIWVVDPTEFSVVTKKIAFTAPGTVTSGANAAYAVVSSQATAAERRTVVVDLDRGAVVHTLSKFHVVTAMTSDGKYTFATDAGALIRFRRSGDMLVVDDIGQRISSEAGIQGIALSADDRFLIAAGTGLSPSMPQPAFHPRPSRTGYYIYSVIDVQRPVYTLDLVTPSHPIALDPSTGFALVSHSSVRTFSMYSFNGLRQTTHDLPIQPGTSLKEITVSPLGKETLMRTLDRFYYVTMHVTGEPVVKIDPPKVDPGPAPTKGGKTLVIRTEVNGDFTVRELSLAPKIATVLTTTLPVWDAQGKYLYWLQDLATVHKVNRDFKTEASVNVPNGCQGLALSSAGVITQAKTTSEILVLDPDTLAVRSRFRSPNFRWIGATPHSPIAVTLSTTQIGLFDVKAGKPIDPDIRNSPMSLESPKNLALSPDGKYLIVQAADYSFHRLRIDRRTLHHEEMRVPAVKSIGWIVISPDSKQILVTYPYKLSTKSGKINDTPIHALDNWKTPTSTLPTRVLHAAFDSQGRLYADANGEVRCYPNQVKVTESYVVFTPSPARRLLAPPTGEGLLSISTSAAHWIEKKR